ncbi:class I SAM-dependent methyltransferase [Thalassospira sp. MCCC 1A01428]|uniref:class I SAM-dependent methyltransferase n=1 Tax=Thalassospira sp. MCCC 1A01428 TaxID=1470575 RepID=UPI000A200579|nr:class I SAM-dependent methyltransferase [Thalassospira sp. MCCC 1A01428]
MNLLEKTLQKLRREGFLKTILSILQFPFTLKRRKTYKSMLTKGNISERFTEIYEKNLWLSKESGSGEGSEIAYTEPLRNWLIKTLPQLNVEVFVDAPCGDFNWMKEVLPKIDVKYFGFDIAPSVIDINKKKFSSDLIQFDVANICEDPLPNCDLIMVRDCLFHLSYEDINKFLKNLFQTDYKYLLTTTHINNGDIYNFDIISGDFRMIDLFSYPFNFDNLNVKDRVDDYPAGYHIIREMILVEKKHVPRSINIRHE